MPKVSPDCLRHVLQVNNSATVSAPYPLAGLLSSTHLGRHAPLMHTGKVVHHLFCGHGIRILALGKLQGKPERQGPGEHR